MNLLGNALPSYEYLSAYYDKFQDHGDVLSSFLINLKAGFQDWVGNMYYKSVTFCVTNRQTGKFV